MTHSSFSTPEPLQSPFLHSRFPPTSSPPLVLELGSGSGVIASFLTTHSTGLFGHSSITTPSAEISPHALKTTKQTVTASLTKESGYFLGAIRTDLATGLRSGVADMLVFNPPCPYRGSRRWGWRGGVDWSYKSGIGGSSVNIALNGEYNGVKWAVEKVGTSGRKGGWEVLGICSVMKW
ncbi:hypothetical protein HOY80DRAFT_1018334 [Tuber brumale]|nr:hypothetical protein HOY80DRAFT_1018334 [Tuber brumale]